MRALAMAVFAAGAAAIAAAQTPITLQTVVTGLERPVYVTHAPGDFERIFILEKRGRIRIVKNGSLLPTPFLDIDALVGGGTSDFNEQGLLGLAFHPDYDNNGQFFVYYTRNNGNAAVFQYNVSAGDPDIADASSAERVLLIEQPQTNHNAGWIGFSPIDGYLYISSGDGGGGGDDDTGHTPGVGNGQDAKNTLGAMLRVDVDGDDFPTLPATNYAVPPDNPFIDIADGREDSIWAYGLRNAWRCSFDRATGDLWMADVGQFAWEEISFQPASSTGGENYGWRCREGANNFNTSGDCTQTPFTEPIYEYNHAAGRCSITGGYVYRGCAIPDLQGTYFFGDWCSDDIWSFRYDGVNITDFTTRTELNTFNIASFGEDAYGEMYVCNQNSGIVSKIVPVGGIVGDDCDQNGIDDACDIAAGAADNNGNGVPDSCECPDTNGDGVTDISDVANVLANFGIGGATLEQGDVDGDGDVDISDLAAILGLFGCGS